MEVNVDYINEYIKGIAYITVFLIMSDIILPTGNTKKFVSIICGAILILAFINPITNMFKNGIDDAELIPASKNIISDTDIQEMSKKAEKNREKSILELYKKNVIKKMKSIVDEISNNSNSRVTIEIIDDISKNNYCDITRVNIFVENLSYNTKTEESRDNSINSSKTLKKTSNSINIHISNVDNVSIGKDSNVNWKKANVKFIGVKEFERVCIERIADEFSLDKNIIYINITE